MEWEMGADLYRVLAGRAGADARGNAAKRQRHAAKRMRKAFRESKVHLRSDLSIEEIAEYRAPTIRGRVNYYARFGIYQMLEVMRYFDRRLERWAKRKYKHLKRRQGTKPIHGLPHWPKVHLDSSRTGS